MARTKTERGEVAGELTPVEVARRALYTGVGQRIRSVRKALKISQVDCAAGAQIDVSSLFRIEQGGQNLTLDTLARIAISLGVAMDNLLIDVTPHPDLLVPRSREVQAGERQASSA